MKTFTFISYSRKDYKVAKWIHTKLEKYPYPAKLVAKENRPEHDKFVRTIFLDTKDLPTTANTFSEDIKIHLEEARYLVVLCSKNSVKSPYVNKEIEYFLKTHTNDTSLILPVFIDTVEGNLPDALPPTIMNRNCPIYNSEQEGKSEANQYCFYHIASFLLKVDFTSLYNRYERYTHRRFVRRMSLLFLLVTLLIVALIFMYSSFAKQKQLTRKTEELLSTKFELNIFPFSIVFVYTDNFLSPVIEHIKETGEEKEIYILMPYSMADLLQHQDRIRLIGEQMKEELGISSIYAENISTRMARGSRIGRLGCEGDIYKNVYVDFASTTSIFTKIIEYKKQKYPDLDEEELMKEYTNTFIRLANEQLGNDSTYVHFYIDKNLFISDIKNTASIEE